MMVRVSLGSLAVLGLEDLAMDEAPTTLYVLQYSELGCSASCAFCPQSRASTSDKSLVSRVPWPAVELGKLIKALRARPDFRRVCLQSVVKPGFETELAELVRSLRSACPSLPLSVATTPVGSRVLRELREEGADTLGVGLDAASPRVFRSVGKPLTWSEYMSFIRRGVRVFGKRRVYVHMIFGLGETEREFAETMEALYAMGAEVSLFSFTPVGGTPMEGRAQPPVERYRLVQLVRAALARGLKLSEVAYFEGDRLVLVEGPWLDSAWRAFLTSGCPGCNRPFYNESPKLVYNYPSVRLLSRDKRVVAGQLARAGLSKEAVSRIMAGLP